MKRNFRAAFTPPARGPRQCEVDRDDQVQNHAGGYVFATSALQRARRFLILGGESGTYYCKAPDLLKQNITCLDTIVADNDVEKFTAMAVEISDKGLAPRDDTIVFALAYLSCVQGASFSHVRKLALQAARKVLRTPTRMFAFVFHWRRAIRESKHQLRGIGWGRLMRETFLPYYLNTPLRQLAYHVTKYKQRDGATHRDLLRLLHPKAPDADWQRQLLFAYVVNDNKLSDELVDEYTALDGAHLQRIQSTVRSNVKKLGESAKTTPDDFQLLPYLLAVHEALRCEDPQRAVELINEHRLVREQLNTAVLNDKAVWEAFAQRMPLNALLRNLGKMTSIGLFDNTRQQQAVTDKTIACMTNDQTLRGARIHPLNVYVVREQYKSGRGDKGSLTWTPNDRILLGLERAFYKSFRYAPRTGKRIRVALDVSGSMDSAYTSLGRLTARDAACVMSIAMRWAEGDNVSFVAFCDTLTPLQVDTNMFVEQLVQRCQRLNFGSTDCALPMLEAMRQSERDIDAFVVFTDCETWCGDVKPHTALERYAAFAQKPDVKLVVCAMTGTEFTIADPRNPHMLDIVGLDASTPQLIAEFIGGNV